MRMLELCSGSHARLCREYGRIEAAGGKLLKTDSHYCGNGPDGTYYYTFTVSVPDDYVVSVEEDKTGRRNRVAFGGRVSDNEISVTERSDPA